MTEQSFLKLLRRRIEASTYRATAAEVGLSAAYLHQVVAGRSPVSDRLARALGYERVVVYRKKEDIRR